METVYPRELLQYIITIVNILVLVVNYLVSFFSSSVLLFGSWKWFPFFIKTGRRKETLQEIVLLLLGNIRYTGSGLCTLVSPGERRRCVCLWGRWHSESHGLMELGPYVIGNEMRQISSSPVLYRDYTHTCTHTKCWERSPDNLMNLASSMCAHLLVQPLSPTSITSPTLQECGCTNVSHPTIVKERMLWMEPMRFFFIKKCVV